MNPIAALRFPRGSWTSRSKSHLSLMIDEMLSLQSTALQGFSADTFTDACDVNFSYYFYQPFCLLNWLKRYPKLYRVVPDRILLSLKIFVLMALEFWDCWLQIVFFWPFRIDGHSLISGSNDSSTWLMQSDLMVGSRRAPWIMGLRMFNPRPEYWFGVLKLSEVFLQCFWREWLESSVQNQFQNTQDTIFSQVIDGWDLHGP